MLLFKQALTCLVASIATPFAYIFGADSAASSSFTNVKALVLKNTPPFFCIVTLATPTSVFPATQTLKVIHPDIAQTVLIEYASLPTTAVIYDIKPEAELGLATSGLLRANRTIPQPRSGATWVALGATVLVFCLTFWLQLTRNSKQPRTAKVDAKSKPSQVEATLGMHASIGAGSTPDTVSDTSTTPNPNAAPDVNVTLDANLAQGMDTYSDNDAVPDDSLASRNIHTGTDISVSNVVSTVSVGVQTDGPCSSDSTSDADCMSDVLTVMQTAPPQIKLRVHAPVFVPRAMPMQEMDSADREVGTEFEAIIADISPAAPALASAGVQEPPISEVTVAESAAHGEELLVQHAEFERRGRLAEVTRKLPGRRTTSLSPSPKSARQRCFTKDIVIPDIATLAVSDAARDKMDKLIKEESETPYFGKILIEPVNRIGRRNPTHSDSVDTDGQLEVPQYAPHYSMQPQEPVQPEAGTMLDEQLASPEHPASPQPPVEQAPCEEQPQGCLLAPTPAIDAPADGTYHAAAPVPAPVPVSNPGQVHPQPMPHFGPHPVSGPHPIPRPHPCMGPPPCHASQPYPVDQQLDQCRFPPGLGPRDYHVPCPPLAHPPMLQQGPLLLLPPPPPPPIVHLGPSYPAMAQGPPPFTPPGHFPYPPSGPHFPPPSDFQAAPRQEYAAFVPPPPNMPYPNPGMHIPGVVNPQMRLPPPGPYPAGPFRPMQEMPPMPPMQPMRPMPPMQQTQVPMPIPARE
ncbi:hypothetical protein DENSPDRAFT_270838 [Dentipellis sp. KUC8613]|nr:hypothetical protein DENSPDRAFT_270838 [Dentipellis sp. KUC8613]